MTVNITFTKGGVLDAFLLAWLLFTGAFVYIGVTHLETISRCLVIQTEIIVGGQRSGIALDPPAVDPQEPTDSNTVA